MSEAISPSRRRNSWGCVRLSRNRVRLCCTSGCAMTVTPFTSVHKRGRQEIKLPGLQLGHLQAEVELDVVRSSALPEEAQKLGNVVALAVFDQVRVADVGDAFGALHRLVKIAEFVHEAILECLRSGKHAAIGIIGPIVDERMAFGLVFLMCVFPAISDDVLEFLSGPSLA